MNKDMAAIRDNLCELGRLEIPRPKCQGMQFVATRGRQGFYRTIRENGAKYGLQVKPQGPKRPQLSEALFNRPMTVTEEKLVENALDEENKNENDVYENNNNIENKVDYARTTGRIKMTQKPPTCPPSYAKRQINVDN